ncbi:hypothetical protein BX616_008252 [Lobosporangium transversale]|nr:hypothetical protein BX616_008252 [Lobosporangium transversale]
MLRTAVTVVIPKRMSLHRHWRPEMAGAEFSRATNRDRSWGAVAGKHHMVQEITAWRNSAFKNNFSGQYPLFDEDIVMMDGIVKLASKSSGILTPEPILSAIRCQFPKLE